MLNKTICKKCLDEDSELVGYTPWGQFDDNMWKEKELLSFCPTLNAFEKISIFDPPPNRCKYMLEQLVVDQSNVK